MTEYTKCNEHKWVYSYSDQVRECKNCKRRWIQQWVEIPEGAEIHS